MASHWSSRLAALWFVFGCAGGAAGSAMALDTVDSGPSVVTAVQDNGSNIVCVALDDGLVFFDTGLSTSVAATFRAAMEQRFGRETRALVLTHAHVDHVLGTGAFADVPIIAASPGRRVLGRLAGAKLEERTIAAWTRVFPTFRDAVAEARPALPTVWFEDEVRIGSADRGVVVRLSGGHSACSAWAYAPSAGVIVAGDLVQVERWPYFGDATTDMNAWNATLASWSDLGAATVCPGHGRPVSMEYVGGVHAYFERLVAVVARLKKEGVALEDVIGHADLPPAYWPDDGPAPAWWPACIAGVYEAL